MQRPFSDAVHSIALAGQDVVSLSQRLNETISQINLLESTYAQLKELNAAQERRLATADNLIKQLRAQQKEDPSAMLADIHEYIQKLRDAQERKKRKNNRAVVTEEEPQAASSGGGGGGGAAE